MKAKAASEEASGPETPPSFERRVVLGRWQAAGLVLLLAVPALALTKLFGDRVEQRTTRNRDWVLNAEVPVCGRDGAPIQITLRLERAENGLLTAPSHVAVSPDYLSRFTDVKLRPSVFGIMNGLPQADAAAPVVIELIPDRFGWARGHVNVTTGTGEQLKLELKTFVFP